MKVAIAKPYIGEEERREVLAVLDSGQLTQGAWVERLEHTFAEMHGARYGVATSSGTTALTAALLAHGIGPGDEVIVPSFSFFATASSVLSVHARPVFADVDTATFTLSVASAEAAITPRTRAIMPVHLFGHPADLPALSVLCEQKGLLLLEDAAQAHLASIGERKVGTFGTASFSFYASKNATTGEGGIVLTNDQAVYDKLRRIRNQGASTQYVHEALGYNFRMTNLCAAIGIPQLGRLPEWTQKRRENAGFFARELQGVLLPEVRPGCQHVYHQYTVRAPAGRARDDMVRTLTERGVGARVYYPTPIHKQPIIAALGYGDVELPVSEGLAKTVFSLPVHPHLSPEELAFVAREVNQC